MNVMSLGQHLQKRKPDLPWPPWDEENAMQFFSVYLLQDPGDQRDQQEYADVLGHPGEEKTIS